MSHVRTGIGLLQIFLLLGCSMSSALFDKKTPLAAGTTDPVASSVNDADLRAHPPRPMGGGNRDPSDQSGPMLYPGAAPGTAAPAGDDQSPGLRSASGGSEASADPPSRNVASAEPVTIRGDGVEMNFEGTDIPSAAKALLGDVLHLNFEIDPRVQGSVTLASTGPIARKDVLPMFEDVLGMQNAAVVRNGNFLKIVPVKDAAAHAQVSVGAGGPGFGVSVVPLRYISAASVAKTTDNLLGKPGGVRVDKARNLLLVQGTASEREAAIGIISTFDVEWLRNQSVGVYPLKSTSPDTMIQELQHVFEAGKDGAGAGVIEFQPVTRMNAVMVVTKNPVYLQEATRWVQRLDRSDTNGTTVRTYRLRYGNAEQVAKVLSQIFGNDQSGGGSDSPTNQISPGSTTAKSRLDSLDRNGENGGETGGGLGGGATGVRSGGFGNQANGGMANATGAASTPVSNEFNAFSDKKEPGKEGPPNGVGGSGTSTTLQGVLKNVRVTADTMNNAILVYSNQEDYKVVERALRDIDRPRLEVSIDATVAEVTLTRQLQYGVQYFLANHKGSIDLVGSATQGGAQATQAGAQTFAQTAAQTATQAVASTALQQVAPGFNLLLGSQSSPKAILSALSSVTDVRVLSSPSIVAMDNEPALLQVGDEVPISTGSATILSNSNTPVVNSIQLFNTGVILKVLPHVNSNGVIQLEVEQEVSSVVNDQNSQPTLTPTISERRIHSTVSITSGQTVLLGGLISDNTQNAHGGIPILSDIKVFGGLFGNVDNNNTRTEIIVFIKPQLVQGSVDFGTVTEEFREKLHLMRPTQSYVKGRGN